LKETREELKGVVEVKIKRESYKKKMKKNFQTVFPLVLLLILLGT
jgi:hypothetical protein